jgi:hypothetical protein
MSTEEISFMWTSNEVKFEHLGAITAEERIASSSGRRLPDIRNKALIGGVLGALLGIVVGLMLILGTTGSTLLAGFGLNLPILLGICFAGAGTIAGSFVDLLRDNNAWRDK